MKCISFLIIAFLVSAFNCVNASSWTFMTYADLRFEPTGKTLAASERQKLEALSITLESWCNELNVITIRLEPHRSRHYTNQEIKLWQERREYIKMLLHKVHKIEKEKIAFEPLIRGDERDGSKNSNLFLEIEAQGTPCRRGKSD
jgi:hypothetical protein